MTKYCSVTQPQRAWEGGREREGVNVVIKENIIGLLSPALSREFSGLQPTSVTMSTARPAPPLCPAFLSHFLACFSLSPPVFPFVIVVLCLLFSLGFVSYFISHPALSFCPVIRNTSLSLSRSAFHSPNQVYCDGVCHRTTDKNLPRRKKHVYAKASFASTGCFGTFCPWVFLCVFYTTIAYLAAKTLSNGVCLCFVLGKYAQICACVCAQVSVSLIVVRVCWVSVLFTIRATDNLLNLCNKGRKQFSQRNATHTRAHGSLFLTRDFTFVSWKEKWLALTNRPWVRMLW